MNIAILGAQNSGTRWISGLFARHPEVSKVQHCSIPAGNDCCAKPFIDGVMTADAFVLVTRDASCVRMSLHKEARFENWKKYVEQPETSGEEIIERGTDYHYVYNPTDVISNYQLAIADLMEKFIIPNKTPHAFVSYETLIQFKRYYLYDVLSKFKLDPDSYPWDDKSDQPFLGYDPSNGNDPYFVGSRPEHNFCSAAPMDGNKQFMNPAMNGSPLKK